MPHPRRDPQKPQVLVRRSTNTVELVGLYDEADGSFPTDAKVTLTVRDADGAPVANAAALDMNFVPGTLRFNSTYRVTIPATVDLSQAKYSVQIAVSRVGAVREFNVPCTAIDG